MASEADGERHRLVGLRGGDTGFEFLAPSDERGHRPARLIFDRLTAEGCAQVFAEATAVGPGPLAPQS